MTAGVELLPCGECGMPCRAGEYHPFAACLMFKACHNSETVRANLAEIEALRADAERYRWLRKGANRGANDDIAVVRGLGAMDYGMSGVAYTYSEEIDGDDLDAIIDQARGKGGGEVECG